MLIRFDGFPFWYKKGSLLELFSHVLTKFACLNIYVKF